MINWLAVMILGLHTHSKYRYVPQYHPGQLQAEDELVERALKEEVPQVVDELVEKGLKEEVPQVEDELVERPLREEVPQVEDELVERA